MEKHQLFETWILQDAQLTEDEQKCLNAHLLECDHCRQLKLGWQSTRSMLKTTPMVGPTTGFSQRWKNSLAERRARQQKAQIKRFLRYLIGINVLTLIGLSFVLLLGTNPVNLMATALREVVMALLFIGRAGSVFNMFLRAFPPYVPVLIWVLTSTGFSLAALAWGFSIWKYVIKGVNAK
ncbi:MAG: hypothetical protein LWX83_07755 [Anaerolineae bacterium]|nr:hypothetical protein [Anaerolineae bacterium]